MINYVILFNRSFISDLSSSVIPFHLKWKSFWHPIVWYLKHEISIKQYNNFSYYQKFDYASCPNFVWLVNETWYYILILKTENTYLPNFCTPGLFDVVLKCYFHSLVDSNFYRYVTIILYIVIKREKFLKLSMDEIEIHVIDIAGCLLFLDRTI